MGKPHGFSVGRSGSLRLKFDDDERVLLLTLAQQMAEFVAPAPPDPDADPLMTMVGIDAEAEVPDDPALARLFPDAFTDDPDASVEFRRFTERGLREAKNAHAMTVILTLESGATSVPATDIDAWLGFLNDTRLTLGTRLEISEDNHAALAALPENDPRLGLFHVYDWLTYLQDSLVQQLLAD
jgi:hypothetical protein